MRLEARPPASFSSLLARQRAWGIMRPNAVAVPVPLTTFIDNRKIYPLVWEKKAFLFDRDCQNCMMLL